MKSIIIAAVITAALLFTACTKSGEFDGEWIDLTYDFSESTVYWSPVDKFNKEIVYEGMNPKGYYYSAYRFSAPEHGGTHFDSPIHFAQGRQSVDQVPVDRLVGHAVKIDVSGNAAQDRDYAVTVRDITDWEAEHGRIPDGSIVLIQTGQGRFWGDRGRYMGVDGQQGPEEVKHFPGLGAEAAKWLVENRGIKAAGIDTASIDNGVSTLFETHVALMTNNVPAFENVANLGEIPVKGATVIALPMKIKGGSGGPLRIVAHVPRQ
jgi:kynurenine formamidase